MRLRIAVAVLHFSVEVDGGGGVAEAAGLDGGGDQGEGAVVGG